MTADGRYGPYGYGEDQPSYSRSKVDWDQVDWGHLQDQCVERNMHRFPMPNMPTNKFAEDVRFTWFNKTTIPPAPMWDEFEETRRTALVLRSYEGVDYKPENMWFVRSLISEAVLRTGGEYSVVMLVNVQDKGRNIFESQEAYDEAFRALNIPPELRSITLLWDDGFLESWYSAINEHR